MTTVKCDSCKSVKETVVISKTYSGNDKFALEPMVLTFTLCAQCVGTYEFDMAVA